VSRPGRRLDVVAILATAVALAWPMQGPNGVQNAHYVLVRALASGTAQIDDELGRIGESATNDVSRYRGHVYSNKAPGLALVCVPAFLVLDAAGVVSETDPTRTLWALGLLGCVAPAVGLVLLVRWAGDRVAAPFGLPAGIALALGTLVLPFATLFLSHVLSAFLVFAAFCLLWARRLPAVAGLLAGFAVTTEYPNVIAVVVLGLYALAREPRVRRAAAFGVGAFVGVLPLLAYNQWAFGSIAKVSYRASDEPVDLFHAPTLRVALELVIGYPGLLPLAPIVACGIAALIALWRRGLRAETWVVVALALLFLVQNAAFYSPFGGFSPGPRYLITVLPFLCFPLALSFRALPLTTSALTLVSVLVQALVTATHASAAYDGRWLDRLGNGEVTLSAASLAGVTGAIGMLPFGLAIAVALTAGLPRAAVSQRDVLVAGVAVLAWAALAVTAPTEADAAHAGAFVLPLLIVAAAGGSAAYALRSR
jgi:hypothetical protein